MKFFRSGEILARSMESPLDLARSRRICEISPNLAIIRQKYYWNFADFAVNSSDFGQFWDLQLQPNWPPSVEGRICPIRLTTPVGSVLKFQLSDLVESVLGWAQTRPRPIHGQAYSTQYIYIYIYFFFGCELWQIHNWITFFSYILYVCKI